MPQPVTILGIESSCDDTAAAVIQGTPEDPVVLSNEVMAQNTLHEAFGGVVPEIAARAHTEKLDHAVDLALINAGKTLQDIDAIAVTSGPGLIGGVVAGVMFAKGLSASLRKPLIGVNHLAGHALTPRLTDQLPYPYLMLLVSGGHCQFLIVHSANRFERLGGTIDDAPGEAFDKVARLLGLPQPGGPSIEEIAKSGDEQRFFLPRPLLDRDDCNMSFSGLKTAVLRTRDQVMGDQPGLTAQDQADIAASFQASMTLVLAEKSARALDVYLALKPDEPAFAVAGGVAANGQIREALQRKSSGRNVWFSAPPLALCTDNAAMIAYVGMAKFALGDTDDLSLSSRPRWPLDERKPALLGHGKKGAKA